jgi:lysyl-tRNA synthetase class 2
MTDSIKLTGFDIPGKQRRTFLKLQRMGIEVDATMGKRKLIDEIF